MIFSSYNFVLFFLPSLCLCLFFIQHLKKKYLMCLLGISSLIFYGFWDWSLLWVLLLSIFINFLLATIIIACDRNSLVRKYCLILGITFNLSLLAYFKYSNFFIDNINQIINFNVPSLNIILPLGISFYTFQQIAYLVDIHNNDVDKHNFLNYFLFVTFFPQLIAGPIVHHKEMMPQFIRGQAGYFNSNLIAQGIAFFIIGLFKKVIMADSMASYASPVFNAAEKGIVIPFLEAWTGSVAYTFQIYFDFSGYSDMAIGLGLIFGLKLPINFFSPYKSTSLIEFWKSWHITLSRFLKYYLYIPLGGNQKGFYRRYFNIFLVMFIGGIWHGASWTFILWGFLHGTGIIINHIWRDLFIKSNIKVINSSLSEWTGCFLTLIFLNFTWVFFRSTNIETALNIISGMLGLNGLVLPETYLDYLGAFTSIFLNYNVKFEAGYLFLGLEQLLTLFVFLIIVLTFPNTTEFTSYLSTKNLKKYSETQNFLRFIKWKPNIFWGLLFSFISIICLIFMSRSGEFLYFQF